MIIYGNTSRVRSIVMLGASVSIGALLASLFFIMRGQHIHLAYALLGLCFVVATITSATLKRSREGYLKLSSSGISLLVGFRPVFLEWENIASIETGRFNEKPFLGISVKDISSLRKMIQNIAMLNRESAGYHFCLAGSAFDRPLEEILQLLTSYFEDEERRKSLPQEASTP